MPHVRIALPSGFSFDGVVRSHGWYDLPPFAYGREAGVLKTVIDGTTLFSAEPTSARASRSDEGAIGRADPSSRAEKASAEVTFRARDGRLRASSRELSAGELRRIATRVFSLDVDLAAFETAVKNTGLRRVLERGSGRMLRAPTLFEDAVKMLLTTNCSWETTRGMVVRLIALVGGASAFPSAEAIADLSTRRLRDRVRCGYRAEALRLFARRVASGRLDLSAWEDRARPAESVREEILAERGFGPYAAEGLLRILGRHEFLALDSWTRQKYRHLYPGPPRATDRSIARRYARYGAFRGLALWLDLTSDWHEAKERVWP